MRNATFTKQNYGTLQAGQKNQNILHVSPMVKVQRERGGVQRQHGYSRFNAIMPLPIRKQEV